MRTLVTTGSFMTHLSAIWESFSPLCPAISLRARIWLIFSSVSWSFLRNLPSVMTRLSAGMPYR